MLQTIINMISGLAGGNIAGAAAKKINPGMIISSITGIAGGGLGGALISSSMYPGGQMDVGSILSGIAGSGGSGAILTIITGYIKSKMAAR